MNTRTNALKEPEVFSCDVMVIGGGGAGLRAAIAARAEGNRSVFIVSKSRIGRTCNTYISKGIVASSGHTDFDDSADTHLDDTLSGGRFLNDPAIAARMTHRIPSEINFLMNCGVPFSREGAKLQVLKTPGHKYPRHVYPANWKGSDLVLPLKRQAQKSGVRFFENIFVTRLSADNGSIRGAMGISAESRLIVFQAGSVILATGGYSQIFLNNNNAAGITGDGQALSYRLGVPLKDMEFVQYYPTALGRRGSRLFLNEKLLAQEGVSLENSQGEDIFEHGGYPDPLEVTRDQLAQLVMKEINESKPGTRYAVMNLEKLPDKTAGQLAQLLPSSWQKGHRKFHVVPTTHYCMGGIVTDDCCQTAVKGLFAVGEAATGCHGANRLGGNSLAEVFAMGSLAGQTAAEKAPKTSDSKTILSDAADEKERLEAIFSEKGEPVKDLIDHLKKTMWNKAGIIRREKDLEKALDVITGTWPHARVTAYADLKNFLEFENMRLAGEMVCRAALLRTESRGSHFRLDYPEESNNAWQKNIVVSKGQAGMELSIIHLKKVF